MIGDPLASGSDQPLDSPTSRTDSSRPRAPKRQASAAVGVGAGTRLALCVGAVFASTMILSQQGESAAEVPNATSASVSQPLDSSNTDQVDVAARKRILVSDPANTAIVREIAGELLTVESIVPPGANGHTYEPVPSDAIRAATADLYIENGMELNEEVNKFVRANYKSGTPEVTLADVIPANEIISTDSAETIAAHGHAHSYNAHFWTDPNYAILYAQRVSAALSQIDSANAATYSSRTDAFVKRLQLLDGAFRTAIASIPAQNKKLIVYHDSWSYFGRRYGIPIVGAIQPVSFSEPSANELRKMIDQIKAQAVPAFFGSEVFPSDVLNAIAAETNAKYFDDLSDEELPGVPGSPEHSYEGMMIQNVRIITSALGGNISLLDGLVPGASS